MAIARDSVTNTSLLNGNPITFSHTCSGSNRLLLVFVEESTDDVTAVTYNGVTMTQLAKYNYTGTRRSVIYGLLSPALGTNTVSITNPSGGNHDCGSVSYTGVKQTGLPDALQTGSSASGTTVSASITTILNNCAIAGQITVTNSVTFSSGTNVTVSSDHFSARGVGLIENTGLVATPAGSYTMSAVFSADAGVASINLVSFAPSETMVVGQGSFTLTGESMNFVWAYILALANGVFTLTGYDLATKLTGWRNQAKSSGSWTNQTKH